MFFVEFLFTFNQISSQLFRLDLLNSRAYRKESPFLSFLGAGGGGGGRK